MNVGTTQSPRSSISRDASANRGSSRSINGRIQDPQRCNAKEKRNSPPKRSTEETFLLFISSILTKIAPLKTTKIFLAAAVPLLAAAFLLDTPARDFVVAHPDQTLRLAARSISKYTEWQWLMLAAAVPLAVFIRQKKEYWKRLLILMMISCSLAGIAADTARCLTGRARPNSGVQEGWYGVRHDSQWILFNSHYNSFPSGHTAVATALIAPLLLLRRRIGWCLIPLPVVIGAARVWVGAHHPSDIAAGALLGFAIAHATLAWCARRQKLIDKRGAPPLLPSV